MAGEGRLGARGGSLAAHPRGRLRRWTAVLASAACMAGSGCSFQAVGRSIGHGAADGGVRFFEEQGAKDRVRRVSDSLLAEVSASFRAHLRPTLDSTLDAALDQGDQALGDAQESLAVALEGRLSGALEHLVRSNLGAAGAQGRIQLDRTIQRVAEDMEQDLTPALRRSIAEATRALMAELSDGVRTRLAVAAEAVVSGAVTAGVKAGTGGVRRSPVWRTLVWIAVGIVGSIVFLGIAWLIRERRRSLAALDVVAGEINRRGDDALKTGIQRQAVTKGVEGWLHGYLARRGHL